MDVVIYARYSSDKQREESIEGQLRECKAFAERNGYRVIKTYIDRAMSAKTDNRPDFLQMIKDSAKTAFEAVIVWKLDRFARNRYDSAHYKRILRKNGVKVISATENLSDGADSIILESVLEGMAEYYSVDLAEKVSRGMTENALKAKFNGGSVPFGFKISKNGFYQIDLKTSPVVQKIFEMYADSGTITEILQYLKEYGVKNNKGKDFTFNSIRKMLGNRRYLGEYQYKDIVLPDKIPRIISDELYERVQQRMKDNARAPAKHKAIDDYILSTKLICGHCGASMVGESGTAKSGLVYHYYKCATAKRKKSCPKKTVRKVEIEEIVLKKCIEIIFSDDRISKIADEVIRYQKEDNKEIPLLKQEIKETEKSIQNLVKAIEQGAFTKSVKTRLDTLETVLDELKTKLIQAEIAKTLITKEMVVFYFQKFRELDFTKLENKQALVDNLVNKVILYDDRFIIFFNHSEKQTTVGLDKINCSDLGTLGSAEFICGEEKFTSATGDIIITQPNVMHSIYPCANTRQVYDTLVFSHEIFGGFNSDRYINECIKPLINGSMRVQMHITSEHHYYVELKTIVENIFSCAKGDTPQLDMLMRSELLRFFWLLETDAQIDVDFCKSNEIVRPALEYIAEHFREIITIKQLASTVHLSESYFMNQFQKHVGLSTMEYISHFRINQVCKELIGTKKSVLDIALDCGFRNVSNFNRQFLKIVGCSPTQYRKKFLIYQV